MSIFKFFGKKNDIDYPRQGTVAINHLSLEARLIDACLQNDSENVINQLRKGANPNLLINIGMGPVNALHFSKHNHRIMQILLENGADPNIRAGHLSTALESACAGDDYDAVCLLLRHKASVFTKDNDGWTPLMFSCSGSYKIPQLLLALGANANDCDRDGWSVLMQAAKFGNEAIVKMLLCAGANIDSKDKDGNTAISVAIENDNPEIAALIKDGTNDKESQSDIAKLRASLFG